MRNRAVRSPADYLRMFHPVGWQRLHQTLPSPYRPLRETSFGLVIATTGGSPEGFRLYNLICYTTSTGLLLLVLRQTLRSRRAAWWAAACYAVHPVHAEAVAWIKNLGEVQALALALGSVACFFTASRNRTRRRSAMLLFASYILYAAALLTKESAGFVPFALLLAAWWGISGLCIRRSAPRLVPMFLMLGVYLSLQSRVLAESRPDLISAGATLEPGRHVGLILHTVSCYARIVLFPIRLSPWRTLHLDQPADVTGAAAVALGLVIAFEVIRRHEVELAWWVAVSALSLVPAANILVNSDRPIADQRALIPSIGAAAILGSALAALRMRRSRFIVPVSLLLLGVMASLTAWQASIWRSRWRLWRTTVRLSPARAGARAALAMTYYQSLGQHRQATQELMWALAKSPDDAAVLEHVAPFLGAQQKLSEREEQLRAMTRVEPRNTALRLALARVQEKMGLREEALRSYDLAIALKPKDVAALYSRGLMLDNLGRAAEAERDYRAVLLADPHHARAASNLGYILLREGKINESIACFRSALAARPGLSQAMAGIGQALLRDGRPADAIAFLRGALEQEPGWVDLWGLVAEAHSRMGEVERARRARRKMEQEKPRGRQGAQEGLPKQRFDAD